MQNYKNYFFTPKPITPQQKKIINYIFKEVNILKLETIFFADDELPEKDYKASFYTLYVSRVFSNCEASVLLLEKSLYSECRILLRTGFEAALILHFLIKHPEFISKYEEHSIVQRYIELINIQNNGICNPQKTKNLKADIISTKKKLYKLKHYNFKEKDIDNIKHLIRSIGPIPISVFQIINKAKEGHAAYFKHAFFGQRLEVLNQVLYGNGSSEVHSYFSNVSNTLSSDKEALFFILGLMHSALYALEQPKIGYLSSVDTIKLRSKMTKIWATI